jgi:polyhydroxybutyrate depolymerase
MPSTRWIFMTLLGVLAGLALGADTQPATQPAPGALVREYVKIAGGELRSYLVHEPSDVDRKTKLPLLLCLHGATDNAAYAAEAYGWIAKADKEHFLAVFPEGLPDEIPGMPDNGQHYWTPGYMNNAQESDDVRFLRKMIDRLENRYPIDPTRIFLCGHSNGAVMAYMLAARHPEKIAALAIVAGTIGVQDQERKLFTIPTPKAAVPLLIFHGREDPNLPYDPPAPATQPAGADTTSPAGAAYQSLGVPASVAFWVQANHCDPKPKITTSEDGEVTRESYTPANPGNGAPITLLSLKHGNHMWPGAKDMPGKTQKPSRVLDATAEMWTFFTTTTRPAR